MNIRTANISDQQAWDDYVREHPNGLAYHQYAWKSAVEKAYGFKGTYLLAEDEGVIRGVLPLIEIVSPLKKHELVSLPYCDVGGALSDESYVSLELMHSAIQRSVPCKRRPLQLRCGHKQGFDELERPTNKMRLVLDLPETSDALQLGFKSKLRSQINKPLRDGLKVCMGGGELLPDFYQVFCQNMRKLGSPVHSKAWFRAVVAFFGDKAKVGVVYTSERTPAAAGILLCHKITVSVPWASSLRHLNHLNANMLLYWSFLSFAADAGYKVFDFGRSTPGEGTFAFKLQWGSRPEPLYWMQYELGGAVSEIPVRKTTHRLLAAKCWQHLPLGLCNSLGPVMRRHISL